MVVRVDERKGKQPVPEERDAERCSRRSGVRATPPQCDRSGGEQGAHSERHEQLEWRWRAADATGEIHDGLTNLRSAAPDPQAEE